MPNNKPPPVGTPMTCLCGDAFPFGSPCGGCGQTLTVPPPEVTEPLGHHVEVTPLVGSQFLMVRCECGWRSASEPGNEDYHTKLHWLAMRIVEEVTRPRDTDLDGR